MYQVIGSECRTGERISWGFNDLVWAEKWYRLYASKHLYNVILNSVDFGGVTTVIKEYSL